MAGSVKWLRANEERAAEEEEKKKRERESSALGEERLRRGSRGTGMKSMLV